VPRLVEPATRPRHLDPLADASAPASQIFRLGYFGKKSGDAMGPGGFRMMRVSLQPSESLFID